MNATVTVTTVTIPANKELDKKEAKLYYLIIETDKGKTVVNIGEKSYTKINDITKKK